MTNGTVAGSFKPDVADTPDTWWPDFQVKSIENTIWQVAIKSRKGADWARTRIRSDLFGREENVTTTDIASINHLLGHARNNGLKIEYIGPNQIVRF